MPWRTRSRSTIAWPLVRPWPSNVTVGDTTPDGRSSATSTARYEFTSDSVTVVRARAAAVGVTPPRRVISATLTLNASASRRATAGSGAADSPMESDPFGLAVATRSRPVTATRHQRFPRMTKVYYAGLSVPGFFAGLGRILPAASLAGAHEQLDLPLLHRLLEDAEPRLLSRVQHLIDRLALLLNLAVRARLVIVKRLEPLLENDFIDRATPAGRHPPQLLEHPQTFALRPPPCLLPGANARQEARELLVAQLQH